MKRSTPSCALHKFPVTVLTKSSTPCCALQKFPVTVLTKSSTPSCALHKFPVTLLTKSSNPDAPCRNSLWHYSRRAPTLMPPAEVPCPRTHQALHISVTLAVVTWCKVTLAKRIGFAVKFRQCKRWREATNRGYSAGMSARESSWAEKRHSASWWERKAKLASSLSLLLHCTHGRRESDRDIWPTFIVPYYPPFAVALMTLPSSQPFLWQRTDYM